MVVRPLNQFCCGCSLVFGASLVILINLVQNLFYIFTATSNIIFRVPTFGANVELTEQTFQAAFCMLGLPFIMAAAWGVYHRIEGPLRLYLVYMLASFTLDLVYLATVFLFNDVCDTLPELLKKHGHAFACGAMRIFAVVFVSQVITFQSYFIYTIWSLCEDIKGGGSGTGFPELLRGEQPTAKRYYAPKPSDHYSYLFGPSSDGIGNLGGYPVGYGAAANPTLGGSARIFGGDHHEANFPPAARFG